MGTHESFGTLSLSLSLPLRKRKRENPLCLSLSLSPCFSLSLSLSLPAVRCCSLAEFFFFLFRKKKKKNREFIHGETGESEVDPRIYGHESGTYRFHSARSDPRRARWAPPPPPPPPPPPAAPPPPPAGRAALVGSPRAIICEVKARPARYPPRGMNLRRGAPRGPPPRSPAAPRRELDPVSPRSQPRSTPPGGPRRAP